MTERIDYERLEVLARLGGARHPIHHMDFIRESSDGRDLFGIALDLVDMGLVSKTTKHMSKETESNESFYELTEMGREYLDSLVKLASESKVLARS